MVIIWTLLLSSVITKELKLVAVIAMRLITILKTTMINVSSVPYHTVLNVKHYKDASGVIETTIIFWTMIRTYVKAALYQTAYDVLH